MAKWEAKPLEVSVSEFPAFDLPLGYSCFSRKENSTLLTLRRLFSLFLGEAYYLKDGNTYPNIIADAVLSFMEQKPEESFLKFQIENNVIFVTLSLGDSVKQRFDLTNGSLGLLDWVNGQTDLSASPRWFKQLYDLLNEVPDPYRQLLLKSSMDTYFYTYKQSGEHLLLDRKSIVTMFLLLEENAPDGWIVNPEFILDPTLTYSYNGYFPPPISVSGKKMTWSFQLNPALGYRDIQSKPHVEIGAMKSRKMTDLSALNLDQIISKLGESFSPNMEGNNLYLPLDEIPKLLIALGSDPYILVE